MIYLKKLGFHIKRIDFFSKQININMQGQKNFRNPVGIVLTTFLFLFLLIAGISFSDEIFARKYPQITYTSIIEDPQTFYLGSYENPFFISLMNNDWQNWYDPQVFQVYIELYHYQLNINEEDGTQEAVKTTTNVAAVPCNSTHFSNPTYKDWFDNIQIGYTFCMPYPIVTSGAYELAQMNTFSVVISRCSQDCKSDGEIDSLMRSNIVNIFYIDSKINQVNGYNPIQSYGSSQFTSISQQFPQEVSLKFKNQIVEVDGGLMTESVKSFQSLYLEEFKDFVVDSDVILRAYIDNSRGVDVEQFRYKKIQAVLGQLGGIFQICFFLLNILYSPFLTRWYHSEVQQNLFDIIKEDRVRLQQKAFEELKSDITKGIQKQKSRNEINGVPKQRDMILNDQIYNSSDSQFLVNQNVNRGVGCANQQNRDSVIFSNNDKEDRNEEEIENSGKQSIINFQIPRQTSHKTGQFSGRNSKIFHSQYLQENIQIDEKITLNETDQEENITQLSETHIREQFCVVNILNKLDEIEKLQFLLFDEPQRNLFNYIKKNTIVTSDSQQQSNCVIKEIQFKPPPKSKEEFLKHFYQIQRRIIDGNSNSLDKNILLLLDKQFIFECKGEIDEFMESKLEKKYNGPPPIKFNSDFFLGLIYET